jgi:hypothetical protein
MFLRGRLFHHWAQQTKNGLSWPINRFCGRDLDGVGCLEHSLSSGEAQLKEAGTLLSASGERMGESGLDRAMRKIGLIFRVIESELSEVIVPED